MLQKIEELLGSLLTRKVLKVLLIESSSTHPESNSQYSWLGLFVAYAFTVRVSLEPPKSIKQSIVGLLYHLRLPVAREASRDK